MNKINALSAILVVLFGIGFFTAAQAQRPYRVSEDELKNLLQRIEKGSERFRGSLDAALDKSHFDGSKSEDNINAFVKGFEQAADHLEGRFSEKRSAASDVEDVLQRAALIDRFMTHHALTARAQEDWTNLRKLLDELAAAYNVTWGWGGVSAHPHRTSEKDVKALLSRMERNADRFRKSLDAALDKSLLDGSKAEDNINDFITNFEKATDRLKDRYSDDKTAAGVVQEILQRAALIDGFVMRHAANTRAKDDWMAVRTDLDELAMAYNVSWQWQSLTR